MALVGVLVAAAVALSIGGTDDDGGERVEVDARPSASTRVTTPVVSDDLMSTVEATDAIVEDLSAALGHPDLLVDVQDAGAAAAPLLDQLDASLEVLAGADGDDAAIVRTYVTTVRQLTELVATFQLLGAEALPRWSEVWTDVDDNLRDLEDARRDVGRLDGFPAAPDAVDDLAGAFEATDEVVNEAALTYRGWLDDVAAFDAELEADRDVLATYRSVVEALMREYGVLREVDISDPLVDGGITCDEAHRRIAEGQTGRSAIATRLRAVVAPNPGLASAQSSLGDLIDDGGEVMSYLDSAVSDYCYYPDSYASVYETSSGETFAEESNIITDRIRISMEQWDTNLGQLEAEVSDRIRPEEPAL